MLLFLARCVLVGVAALLWSRGQLALGWAILLLGFLISFLIGALTGDD